MPVNETRASPRAARHYAIAPAFGGIELLSATHHAHVFAPHAHDTLLLGVVESGRVAVQCEGRTLDAGPGDVVVVAPGTIHGARARTGGWSHRSLYLTDAQWRVLAGGTSARPTLAVSGGALLREAGLAAMLGEAHAALAESAWTTASEGRLDALLATVVLECTRALGASARLLTVSARVERVRAYIDQHLHRRLPLDELAEVAMLSRFGLVRAFTHEIGVSPYAYSMMRRVDHARRRLVAGAGISMTAHQLGFADQSHLTRWFLRIVGVTPGEYLRAQLHAAAQLPPAAAS